MSHDNFDDIFELLDSDRLEALYDQYVEEYKDTPDPVTPELDAAMQKRFDELRRKEQWERRKKKALRIAATWLIIAGVGGFFITKTEAWRVAIGNFKISFSDTTQQGTPSINSDTEKLSIIPAGIPYPSTPDGYSIKSVDAGELRVDIIYQQPKHPEINYMVYSNDYGAFEQRAEEKNAIPVDINGIIGTIVPHGDTYDIIWNTQDYIMKLSGCVEDVNILINIAKSVE